MYLTTDIIGASSGTQYGRKGDEVTVLDGKRDLTLVRRGDGIRFFVHPSNLSEEPIKPDPRPVEAQTVKKKRR